ncbi:MAG: Hpt domain-containing protein [Planctomycetes bacterium]|nr:Hpt domain-containing protein [Planctomycetota bacterium]
MELDTEELLENFGGDLELLQQVMDLFIRDCPNLMAEIRDAMERQDADRLQSSAHSLKGAVGNFGQGAAFQTALDLEKVGKSRDLKNAPKLYRELALQIEALNLALGKVLEK